MLKNNESHRFLSIFCAHPRMQFFFAAAVVCILLSAIGVMIYGQVRGLALPPLPAVKVVAAPRQAPLMVNQWHVFGQITGPATQALKITALNVKLNGVFVTEPAQGTAVISVDGKRAKVYAVGAVLADGVHLHAVYGDRVVLKNGDKLEVLRLVKKAQ